MGVGGAALRKLEEICERAVQESGSDWALIRARIRADRSQLDPQSADELSRTCDLMFSDRLAEGNNEANTH